MSRGSGLRRSPHLGLALAFLLVGGGGVVAGAAAPSTDAPKAGARKAKVHKVLMKGKAFVPATLEVAVGDTVVFVNADDEPHTATALPSFNTGTLKPQESWRITATAAGEIPYSCILHPGMTGTLLVHARGARPGG